MRIRTLAALAGAAALTVGLAACGDDDAPAAPASTSAAATTAGATTAASTTVPATTTTKPAPSTTAAASTTTATGAGEFGPEEQAAATAFTTVFDSATPFDDKVPFLEHAESLRATNEAYAGAAEGLGGIAVEPTAVLISGDGANVTYRVLFAGTEAYAGLTADLARGSDGWVVPKAAFCSFMASARTPCQP